MWEKGEKTEKQPVAVYDVAKGITAIAKDPKNTAGKTYQFVGYGRLHSIVSQLLSQLFSQNVNILFAQAEPLQTV